jgi:hypothetical protein
VTIGNPRWGFARRLLALSAGDGVVYRQGTVARYNDAA